DLASVIRDHDTSSPVTQLAQNTPPQLMRKSITKTPFNETEQWVTDQNLSAEDRALLTDPHAPETDEQQARADQLKHEYLLHHLQQAGIDTTRLTPEDHTNLKAMLDNGPYSFTDDGVTLDAIWYGRINDV